VLERASADPLADCERESIRYSLDNLLTFPWIAERVADGRLALTGAIFDIRSGVLAKLQANGEFKAV
jgi:carbonic anhydrase